MMVKNLLALVFISVFIPKGSLYGFEGFSPLKPFRALSSRFPESVRLEEFDENVCDKQLNEFSEALLDRELWAMLSKPNRFEHEVLGTEPNFSSLSKCSTRGQSSTRVFWLRMLSTSGTSRPAYSSVMQQQKPE